MGLLITKDSPIISFLKSITEPDIISSDALSIITFSNKISSLSKSFSKLKSYLNPEQPPPFTDILKYFLALSLLIIFSICSFAWIVNFIFFFVKHGCYFLII